MTFQERYQYNTATDLLGKGGFARVYKATDSLLDREVAIKVFNATDQGQYTVIEEIKKAIRLQHPNLLRYYDVAVLNSTNALGEIETLQIGVMELANAGDLKQFVKKNPNSPMLFSLLQQVLSGLEYLHQKGIIHRDMKPQNILLVEEDGVLTAKISDFGISKSLDSGTNSASMAIGTIEYMAPEQFSPAKYGINGKIGTNVDLWSFGIMVHELLTNEPLFGQRNGNTTAEQIMNSILSQTLPQDIENLPEPYKTVVKKCLVSDARERIQKANELISILNQTKENNNFYDNDDDQSNETVLIDKKLLSKINQTPKNEKAGIPKQSIAKVEIKKNIKTLKSFIKKKPIVLFLGIALVIILLGSSFLWFNNNTHDGKEEYQLALKSKIGSAEYLKHLKTAATQNNDSANWKLAHYYFEKDNLQLAKPFVEKIIDTKNPEKPSLLSGVKTIYGIVLLKQDNKKEQAIKVFESDAHTKNGESAYQLGLIYYNGVYVEKNYFTALKWFNLSANNNNDKSQAMLGTMYCQGDGVRLDFIKGMEYYYKAAQKSNTFALYGLGVIYYTGNGVQKNEDEAKKWFLRAVKEGNNVSVINAAKEYLSILSSK
jgi:serine/threonine protein kinase